MTLCLFSKSIFTYRCARCFCLLSRTFALASPFTFGLLPFELAVARRRFAVAFARRRNNRSYVYTYAYVQRCRDLVEYTRYSRRILKRELAIYEANGTPVIGRESLTRKDYCLLVGHKKMHVPPCEHNAHLYTLHTARPYGICMYILVARC